MFSTPWESDDGHGARGPWRAGAISYREEVNKGFRQKWLRVPLLTALYKSLEITSPTSVGSSLRFCIFFSLFCIWLLGCRNIIRKQIDAAKL